MLQTIGTWSGIISAVIVVLGVIFAIVKGGLGIFTKLNKIDNIEQGVDALLILHADKIIELYKDKIRIVFNPMPSPYSENEKTQLLQKLQSGDLNRIEAQRLTGILKYEENKAKEKDQQMAVLAIGALILLIALLVRD
jgi:hypothetical protein